MYLNSILCSPVFISHGLFKKHQCDWITEHSYGFFIRVNFFSSYEVSLKVHFCHSLCILHTPSIHVVRTTCLLSLESDFSAISLMFGKQWVYTIIRNGSLPFLLSRVKPYSVSFLIIILFDFWTIFVNRTGMESTGMGSLSYVYTWVFGHVVLMIEWSNSMVWVHLQAG